MNGLKKAFKRAVGIDIFIVNVHTLQVHTDNVEYFADHIRWISKPVNFLNNFTHDCDVSFEPRIECRSQLRKQLHFLVMSVRISKWQATLLVLQMLARQRERSYRSFLICFFRALRLLLRFTTCLIICFFTIRILIFYFCITHIVDNLIIILNLLHPFFVKYLVFNEENVLMILAIFGLLMTCHLQWGLSKNNRSRLAAQ